MWAKRRADWLRDYSGPRSLRAVGRHKPMGNLDADPSWAGAAQLLFNRARLLGRGNVMHTGVEMYAWHTHSAQAVLEAHADVFREAGWPTWSIRAWIADAQFQRVWPCTPLFDAVSDMFGDDWTPGRSDILPGVPREVLLRASAQELGAPDPAARYFRNLPEPSLENT